MQDQSSMNRVSCRFQHGITAKQLWPETYCSQTLDGYTGIVRLPNSYRCKRRGPVVNTRSSRILGLVALLVMCPVIACAEPLPVKTVEFDSKSVGRKMKYNI